MAVNFPDSPTNGDSFETGGLVFTYNSTTNSWDSTSLPSNITSSDSAPSNPANGDLWFHTGQLKLYVYYADGTSNQWVQTNPGAAAGVDEEFYIKSYRYDDTLAINTGTTRLYLHDSYTLSRIHAYVDTAPDGAAATFDVKKNGSSLQTITIADGATSGSNTTMSHVVTGGDYITVDITQVGSNTAGQNLYMVFTFS